MGEDKITVSTRIDSTLDSIIDKLRFDGDVEKFTKSKILELLLREGIKTWQKVQK